jgi:cysteine-rich repeat protein
VRPALALRAAAGAVACSAGDGHSRGVCGNGVIEGFEQCDDGNDDPHDGCHECRWWVPPSGDPIAIDAPNAWQWVPVEGAVCRDGSPAGFSINAAEDAVGVVFYFEGGGACFDPFSCLANPANISVERRAPAPAGIFDRGDPRNPFADWHFVFLPYCTGDIFGGTRQDVEVPSMAGVQQFVGEENLRMFLDRVVPTFADVDTVVVTGVSAGGMAALANAMAVGRAFGDARIVMLNDAGPPLTTRYAPRCLQQHWRELWGLEDSILADCGAGCVDGDDYLIDGTLALASRRSDWVQGLVAFDQDLVVRLFYGLGQSDCAFFPLPLSAEQLSDGLRELGAILRENTDTFGTFVMHGEDHTCIEWDCFYAAQVGDVPLTDWVTDLVEGRVTHVGAPR